MAGTTEQKISGRKGHRDEQVKFHPPQSAKQGSRPQTEPDVLPKKFLEVTKPKVKGPIILLKI